MVKLLIGQEWVSKSHPHENFRITGGVIDTCSDQYDHDKHFELTFDVNPESTKIFFWERTNIETFNKFLSKEIGDKDSAYPYSWNGECKKPTLVRRIKKYDMKLDQ